MSEVADTSKPSDEREQTLIRVPANVKTLFRAYAEKTGETLQDTIINLALYNPDMQGFIHSVAAGAVKDAA